MWIQHRDGVKVPYSGTKLARILLLDVNLHYVNRTRLCLAKALEAAAVQVDRFGPGFTPSDVLQRGLLEFLEGRPAYDAIVASEHLAFPIRSWTSAARKMFRSNYVYYFPDTDLASLPRIGGELRQVDVFKVATLLETDLYRMTPEWLDELEGKFDCFVGFGEQFVRRRDELPGLAVERFAADTTDVWADFSRSQGARVISLPHFVDESEIDRGALIGSNRFDVAVPGVLYHDRAQVLAKVQSSPLKVAPRRPDAWSVLRRIVGTHTSLYLRSQIDRQRQMSFAAQISNSTFSFTCGSRLRWPLRKFFEIPALGGLLVCIPFSGAESAGFLPGQHYLSATADSVLEVIADSQGSPSNMKQIVRDAQDLIRRRHSVQARGSQLSCALEVAQRGCLQRTKWEGGDFIVESTG